MSTRIQSTLRTFLNGLRRLEQLDSTTWQAKTPWRSLRISQMRGVHLNRPIRSYSLVSIRLTQKVITAQRDRSCRAKLPEPMSTIQSFGRLQNGLPPTLRRPAGWQFRDSKFHSSMSPMPSAWERTDTTVYCLRNITALTLHCVRLSRTQNWKRMNSRLRLSHVGTAAGVLRHAQQELSMHPTRSIPLYASIRLPVMRVTYRNHCGKR